jgi:hypothetical protein
LERATENPDVVDVIGHIAPEPSFTLEPNEIEQLAKIIWFTIVTQSNSMLNIISLQVNGYKNI